MGRKKVPMVEHNLTPDDLIGRYSYEKFEWGGIFLSINQLGYAGWSCKIKQNIINKTSTRITFTSKDKQQQISLRIPVEKVADSSDFSLVIDSICQNSWYTTNSIDVVPNLSMLKDTTVTSYKKFKDINNITVEIISEDAVNTVLASRTEDELLTELTNRQLERKKLRPRKRKQTKKSTNIVYIKELIEKRIYDADRTTKISNSKTN